jgi:hypothetical protein
LGISDLPQRRIFELIFLGISDDGNRRIAQTCGYSAEGTCYSLLVPAKTTNPQAGLDRAAVPRADRNGKDKLVCDGRQNLNFSESRL